MRQRRTDERRPIDLQGGNTGGKVVSKASEGQTAFSTHLFRNHSNDSHPEFHFWGVGLVPQSLK